MQYKSSIRVALCLCMLLQVKVHAAVDANAEAAAAPSVVQAVRDPYLIQPGDQLAITVWGEADLSSPVIVRPDGALSFPLIGDLSAAERTPPQLADSIRQGLLKFLPDPIVTVAVARADGNVVYVIGKVNRPGAFAMNRTLNVVQALALAGGLDPFADADDIVIVRQTAGRSSAIRFDFTAAARGRELERIVPLVPGDVVIVP